VPLVEVDVEGLARTLPGARRRIETGQKEAMRVKVQFRPVLVDASPLLQAIYEVANTPTFAAAEQVALELWSGALENAAVLNHFKGQCDLEKLPQRHSPYVTDVGGPRGAEVTFYCVKNRYPRPPDGCPRGFLEGLLCTRRRARVCDETVVGLDVLAGRARGSGVRRARRHRVGVPPAPCKPFRKLLLHRLSSALLVAPSPPRPEISPMRHREQRHQQARAVHQEREARYRPHKGKVPWRTRTEESGTGPRDVLAA